MVKIAAWRATAKRPKVLGFRPQLSGSNGAYSVSRLASDHSAGKKFAFTAAELRHFFECGPKNSGHALAEIPPKINLEGQDATFDVLDRNGISQPLQAKAFGRKNLP